MTKKKTNCINEFFDCLFWWTFYFLPFFMYIIDLCSSGHAFISFFDFLASFPYVDTFVSAFSQIFGVGGLVPLVGDNNIFILFYWFICSHLIHLAVDVILFIPRILHSFIGGDNHVLD